MFLTRILLLVQFTYRISADNCGSSLSKFGLWTDPDVFDHDGDRPDVRLAYRDVKNAEQITDWVFFDNDNSCNDFDGGWDYLDAFDTYTNTFDVIYLKAGGTNGIVLGGIQYVGPNGNLIATRELQFDDSAEHGAEGCQVTEGSTSFWLDANNNDREKCHYVGIRLCGSRPEVFQLSSDTEQIAYCSREYLIPTDATGNPLVVKATDASAYCLDNYGTTLATVIGETDYATILSAMTAAGATDSVWVGLSEDAGSSTWTWDDGTACANENQYCVNEDTDTPAEWGVDEPNNHGGAEECAEFFPQLNVDMDTDYDRNVWYNDLPCDSDDATRAFACNVRAVPNCANPPDSFDWDTLTADGTDVPEIFTAPENIMSISENTLSLNIHVELQYEGAATGDVGDGPFGVTYVLDFEDFNAYKDEIYAPGTCQNRFADDFYNGNELRPFNEWWQYPINDRNIGLINTMAYPPQTNTFWTQEPSLNDQCGIITYEGTFTWNELIACAKEPGGTSYVSTTDGPTDITLSGVFFINAVSPYAKDSDEGYYRVYQLLSKPFEIRISKSVYVLGEAGINVLSMSVIAVYKENAATEPQNDFRLVVLTESQNYLQLSAATQGYLFEADTNSQDVHITQGEFTWPTDSEQDDDCLSNKAYICSQLWVIKADQVDCGTKGIDFSGTYTLSFATSCRDGMTHCAGDGTPEKPGWLAKHPDIADGVALQAKLTWRDEICDPQIFNVQFDAEMKFFTSADYKDTAGNTYDGTGTPDGEGDYLFQVGKDNIYVEIDTEFASKDIDVFDTKLINVWICTFEPGYELVELDANDASGGCFDVNRDGCEDAADEDECDEIENPYFYHIYQGGVVPNVLLEGFNEIGTDDDEEILRFYFTVPHRIARDSLWVQAQVEVTLQSGGTPRRVLLSPKKSANQMDHFIKQTGLKHDYNDNKPVYNPNNNPQPPQYPQQPINYPQPQAPNPSTFVINLSSPWIIGIGSLLAVVLAFNIIFMCYMNCNKEQRARVSFDARRRNGYSSVKNIDSDVNDSEMNAINVVSDQSS